jgi:hypothetical protein
MEHRILVHSTTDMEICKVAPLVATAIQRNHHDESLADLRVSA